MTTETIFRSTRVLAPQTTSNDSSVPVTSTRQITLDLPAGFIADSVTCFIEDFDLAFKSRSESLSGGQHSIHQFSLLPSVSLVDTTLTISVEFILNKEGSMSSDIKHDTFISPDSYVQVLVVIVPQGADAQSETFSISSSSTAGAPATHFLFTDTSFLSTPQQITTALAGWNFSVPESGQDDQQIACFDMQSGTASISTEGAASVADAYVNLNNAPDSGNDVFDSTGSFTALTVPQESQDFGLMAVSQWGESDRKTGFEQLTFDHHVEKAYAVVQNLTNSGEAGDSQNELASFTCVGPLMVTLGRVVELDWDSFFAHWGDKASGFFPSHVDLLIIAKYGVRPAVLDKLSSR